jgi:DNA-binding IclR family transcriptional regulator
MLISHTAGRITFQGAGQVCISRSLGTSPIQPVPFDVGGRRPFGVGVAGIIALAAMPQSRIDSILFQHAQTYENYGIKTGDIARLVHECREIGYSYNPGLFIKGVSGLGIPIIGVKGQLIGALHIVALDEQLRSKTKRLEVINLLRRAVKRVNSLD